MPELYPAAAASGDLAVDATREATRSQAIVTTRASVLAALAGLGALVTIAINYRNSRTAAQTLATTDETFRITARGHLTDRYTKAIEQLGTAGTDGSLAIRLGGIYALQQFAVDSDRDEDQSTVVEVLSAFVRSNFPRRTGEPAADDDRASEPVEPPPDVLAAISTLAQLPPRTACPLVDFSGADFTGQRLSQARLRRASLPGVDFRGAVLRGADLTLASLYGADLRDVDLSEAGLMNADLTRADLRRADLRGGLMNRTNLHCADLRDAVLRSALLCDADLRGADLRGAFFDGTHLTGADLRGADLRGANFFHDATLSGADLRDARLNPGQMTPAQRAAARYVPDEPDADASAT